MTDDDCEVTSPLNESNISASLDEISVTQDKPSNQMADESHKQVDEHIGNAGTGINENNAPQEQSKKIQAPRSETVQSKAMAKKKKMSATIREEDKALRMISEAIQNQSNRRVGTPVKTKHDVDEFDAYGRHIAHELRSISDPYTRDYVKQEFSRILFAAKWGSNASNSASVISSAPGLRQFCGMTSVPVEQNTGYQKNPAMPVDWNFRSDSTQGLCMPSSTAYVPYHSSTSSTFVYSGPSQPAHFQQYDNSQPLTSFSDERPTIVSAAFGNDTPDYTSL